MAFSPLRIGMVGGGNGAFIGAVHRRALRLDGECILVCGSFSRKHDNSIGTGRSLGMPEYRCYADVDAMLCAEAELCSMPGTSEAALECVSIVTPNDTHVPIATAALANGLSVISDKPAGVSLGEVEGLAESLAQSNGSYALTHTYLGYPMVWQARHIAAQNAFGPVRKIIVNYSQGWLASQAELSGSKQAEWRTDPKRSGPAGAFGDIGSHAHSLVEFICNSRMTRLSARLNAHFPDRLLDDDGDARFEMDNGATGVLIASQVCAGDENELTIRIYGENAGVEWRQMEPNSLIERRGDGTLITHRAGLDKPLCSQALERCRLPSGHPEGYLEAFANIYRQLSRSIRAGARPASYGVPGIAEALRGMAFLEAAVSSSQEHGAWHDIKEPSTGPDLRGLLT
ncbi:MAG: Gfo/Idh/MocA family oxidoreductase [Erythrobacter sp.]|uniref:Gfo/Idh/MocA family protein n=1 Tax=Erythrobacter sp. TaxID=1042 RepID=UPI00329799D6